jgi:drug/metabolite transporter (DMT)-like permease
LSIRKELENEPKAPIIPPIVVLGFGILAASTASIFIRLAQRDVPSLVIAAYRLGLATLILSPFILTRNRNELSRLKRGQIQLMILSGTFLALHFAAWITSLEYTTVASSVVLVTTSPLWVALLSTFILKERLPGIAWIGILIALMGSVVVSAGQICQIQPAGLVCPQLSDFIKGRAFWGDFLALVGAWMAAGYLLIGRKMRSEITLGSYIYIVYGTAAVILLAAVLVTGQKLVGYPKIDYVWFLALALFPQLLGHSSFNWALRYLSAAYVSVTLLGEPIGSALLALIFLGEKPSPLEIVGGLLILWGIYIVSRVENVQR